MSIESGTKIGRYEIRSKIGEGGMGEVYRARDEKLNRDVAVKILPASLSDSGDRLQRFEQEAQAAGTLNHPNILAVYDVGVHEGAPYVVSELLDGESLRDRLNTGPIAQRKAIDYAMQIAHGLAAAHNKGIIHRDIKPDNLFITRDDRVKILDFGLAKLSQPSGENIEQTDVATRRVHTNPGTVMGTAGYMAPEQVRARPVDNRSDIFSFGAVLYEMLSGRRAFHGESPIETLNAILKEEPAELTTSNPNIAPALERVVLHCLEKSLERRFQSASDVAFALESVSSLSSHTSQQTTVGILPPQTRWKSKQLFWVAGGVLLVLLFGSLALSYFSREKNNRDNTIKLTLATPPHTTFPANVSISPDGQRVAFTATNSEGKRLLWVRPLDSLIAQPLAATEGARSPFWSPDSRFIGYFANQKLLKIEASGGRPQTLCDAPENGGGAWNRDGIILVAGQQGLYRISSSGGTPALATKVDVKEEAHRWPSFLPDGRHFVFLADAGTTEDHNIRIGSLDSQDTQILFGAISRIVYAPPGFLFYVNQGALVAVRFDASSLKVTGDATTIAEKIAVVGENHEFDFSVSDDGTLAYQSGSITSQYTWFDRTGKKLGTVGEPAGSEHISLSADGRTAAIGMLDADGRASDVWLVDLSRNALSRFTFDQYGDGTPIWSPDGKRVVFGSNRRGGRYNVDLFEKAASGGGEEHLLLQSDTGKFATSWARNGEFILFDNWVPQSKAGIWTLPLANPYDAKPVLQSTAFNQFQGQISPDGRFVAYVSDESGRFEVYVQRYPPASDKWQISSNGGLQPLWRADGNELFFVTAEQKLMSVEVKTGSSFKSSVPRELFQTPLQLAGGYNYAVSPDGERFLMNSSLETSEGSPMTIVLNWNAKLPVK
jgi:eukaryotic-like serine/threonine-protein kinase